MSDYKTLPVEQQLIAIEKLLKLMRTIQSLMEVAEEATQAFGTEWPAGERYFEEVDANLYEHAQILEMEIDQRMIWIARWNLPESFEIRLRNVAEVLSKSRN